MSAPDKHASDLEKISLVSFCLIMLLASLLGCYILCDKKSREACCEKTATLLTQEVETFLVQTC